MDCSVCIAFTAGSPMLAGPKPAILLDGAPGKPFQSAGIESLQKRVMLTTSSPSPMTTNLSSSGSSPIKEGVVPEPYPVPLRYLARHAPSPSSKENFSPSQTTRCKWSTEFR